MCLYIIHFLLAVNYDKKVVQTHFLLLFVNKKYPETYILLWKGGWFWLFTHFANKKPSASPRAFYCCKMCKKSKSPPFLYYRGPTEDIIHYFTLMSSLLHYLDIIPKIENLTLMSSASGKITCPTPLFLWFCLYFSYLVTFLTPVSSCSCWFTHFCR